MNNRNNSNRSNILADLDTISIGDLQQVAGARQATPSRAVASTPNATRQVSSALTADTDKPLLDGTRVDPQESGERPITVAVAAQLETEMYTIYGPDMPNVEEELKDETRYRAEDGTWMGPYLRFTQQLREGEEALDWRGKKSNWTSFAIGLPSQWPHTMLIKIDAKMMPRTQLSKRGIHFGLGFSVNGMTLEAIGPFCAALMLPGPDNKWVTIGAVSNLHGKGKEAMIFIEHPERLPEPDEKGRWNLVMRNYWAIERDRLGRLQEAEDGSLVISQTPSTSVNASQIMAAGRRRNHQVAQRELEQLTVSDSEATAAPERQAAQRQSQQRRGPSSRQATGPKREIMAALDQLQL